jgi:amino acid adenylation domain-containing protein
MNENNGYSPTIRARRLESLVESAARRYPNAIALETPHDEPLTYRSLVTEAERLAGMLKETISDVPSRIGLLCSKSTRSYVAYLAILKLGSTIVPINHMAPAERLSAIIRAASLSFVLTDQPPAITDTLTRLKARDQEIAIWQIPRLGEPGPEPRLSPVPASSQQTAYIMFTSGSTGRPKGVPISHDNAVTFIEHNIAEYGVGVGDRLSQTFDFSFDVSVYDIFVAWGSGATLIAPGPLDLLHPVRWVNRCAVSHWASVPSIISAAVIGGELSSGCMPALKLSLFIGEQLTREQAQAWKGAAPEGEIENFYGPTELTVAVSSFRLPADIQAWPETANRTVPIGSVYDHLEGIIVADGRLSDEGELCVRGPQRFAGYLDERDNAGRFFVHEGAGFAPLPAGWNPCPEDWYRTGDVVRRGADGVLTCLGRYDLQVKIRGFRVELPEIEGAMRTHPDIHEAVVFEVPGKVGSHELAAFFIGAAADAREVRAHLAELIPSYMIPGRIRRLENFPLTGNGKVDRLALAELLNVTEALNEEGNGAP